MDENDIDIVDELEAVLPARRTDFLTVVCILSWVYATILLIFGLFMLVYSVSAVGNFGGYHALNILPPLACIAGAILMFMLNKIGFFIYLLAQAIPLLISLYTWLIVYKVPGPEIAFIFIRNIPEIILVVLFALNLKTMKPIRL